MSPSIFTLEWRAHRAFGCAPGLLCIVAMAQILGDEDDDQESDESSREGDRPPTGLAQELHRPSTSRR